MSMRVPLPVFAKKRLKFAASGLADGVSLFGEDSPWMVPIDRMRARVEASGRRFINFGHYDYLSLGEHPDVMAAARRTLDTVGLASKGSRLTGGERLLHGEFERELAAHIGTEAALLMVSGYLSSLSLVPHLVGSSDLVIVDELIHSCGSVGAKASRATMKLFRHNDLAHLEEILEAHREQHGLCLIMVEGLYSMDGDMPDLPGLLRLREKYGAWLMIDEAHSIGPVGAAGRGICEHYGVDPNEIDIIMGTLSKTFVSMGGFICARRDVIDWLRFTLPGFVFSVGLSPVIVAASLEALRVAKREPQRSDALRTATRAFIERANARGLNTGQAMGYGIVPVYFETPVLTALVSRALGEAGIYAPPIIQAGIKPNTTRIRFFISTGTQLDDIDAAIDVMVSTLEVLRRDGVA